MRGISWLAEQLLRSRQGFRCKVPVASYQNLCVEFVISSMQMLRDNICIWTIGYFLLRPSYAKPFFHSSACTSCNLRCPSQHRNAITMWSWEVRILQVGTKQAKEGVFKRTAKTNEYTSAVRCWPNGDCQRHGWQEQDSKGNWGTVQRAPYLFIYDLSTLMTLSVRPHSVVDSH